MPHLLCDVVVGPMIVFGIFMLLAVAAVAVLVIVAIVVIIRKVIRNKKVKSQDDIPFRDKT